MNNFNNQLIGWEYGWNTYVKGLEENNLKLINKGINILNAIDPEFVASVIQPDNTQEETTNEVTVYHGTWENITQFSNREVKTYDSIGTWFTAKKEYARMLYGANTIEATVSLKNPIVINNVTNCNSFDQFFYDSSLTNKSFSDINKILLDSDYINSFKTKLIEKGYDGIVFKVSKIDVSNDEESHTVYVVFNTVTITIKNVS